MLPIALRCSILGIALASMAGCGGRTTYSTPQEAFDAHQKATAAKDWKTVLATLTPESRDAMVGMMAMAAVNTSAGDEQIAAVLKKHGVSAEQFRTTPGDFKGSNFADMMKRMKEKQEHLVAAISDKPQFYADVMEQFDRLGQEMVKKMGPSAADLTKANAEAKLVGVEINGDAASGKQSLSMGGKTMELPVQFKKVDGCWLLDFTARTAGAGNPAAPPPGRKP